MNEPFIIFADEDGWRIASAGQPALGSGPWAEHPPAADAPPPTADSPLPTTGEAALAIRRALDDAGWRGGSVLLAPAGQWCLSARIALEGLPKNNRRAAMVYRLEEKLPLPAEEIVAHFIESGEAALGVCVTTARLQPLVEALEKAGVAVASIAPAALLALESIAEQLPELDLVAWSEADEVHLFPLADGGPTGWHLLPNQPAELAPYLKIEQIKRQRPLRTAVHGADADSLRQALGAEGNAEITTSPLPMTEAALTTASVVLAGKRRPWIELRQGALGLDDPHRQLRPALVAALLGLVLLLGSLAGTMLWRGHAYAAQAALAETEQRRVFVELFPGQPAPPASNIRRRIEIEQRRLSGQSQHAHPQTQALPLLNDLLISLPRERRWRLLELRLSAGELYLEGEARSHSDADAIAVSLRGLPRFRIDPPATERRREQAVAFKITGAIPPPAPVASAQNQRRQP